MALIDLNYAELKTQLDAINARLSKLETPPVNVPPPAPVPIKPKLQLGAVSYYRPGTNWDALLACKPGVVIINPNSGPGTAASTSYAQQVAKAKAAGAKVFGYVWTNYGKRLTMDVVADCDKHQRWYNVDGIFLDETSNKAEQLPYYQAVCEDLKSDGLLTCLNPGTTTLEEYVKMADYCMVSEGTYQSYLSKTRPAWELNYPGKLWHCVHSCLPAWTSNAVALAAQRKAGLVWVTDDVPTNPYDQNPSYLTALAAEVAKYA